MSATPENNIKTDYIELSTEGMLIIKKGYTWDGPSGPTIDTRNFMRGSLVHDALYQRLRNEFIEQKRRDRADEELRRLCGEDDMSKVRAWWVHRAVRLRGDQRHPPSHGRKFIKPERKTSNTYRPG